MRLGIMQPYLFPYIGYWQLINAVEKYIIYDDVNYIKGGWINRNRILIAGQPCCFTLKLQKATQNKLINEHTILDDVEHRRKMLLTLKHAYTGATYFRTVYPMLEKIILHDQNNLAQFLFFSIKTICEYLGINTEILVSSNIEKDNSLKAQEKVIAICKTMEATNYINAIGGQSLYSCAAFAEENIKLNFLQTKNCSYKQFDNEFVPNLSIIDVMMFNSTQEIRRLLGEYDLI